MEKYDDPTPLNLGTGQEISITDTVEKIAALMNFDGEIQYDTTLPDGQPRRCLDVTPAREQLGWEATKPFDVGLIDTIQWWRNTKEVPC